MILHPQNPRVGLLSDDVEIRFLSGARLLLSTVDEVDRLVTELQKARVLLQQQAQARSDRVRQGTCTPAQTHVRVIHTAPTYGDVA